MTSPEYPNRLSIRWPLRIESTSLRGLVDLLTHSCGGCQIAVDAETGLANNVDLEQILSTARWGRIRRIIITVPDKSVRLTIEDRVYHEGKLEWTGDRSTPPIIKSCESLIRSWKKYSLLPAHFVAFFLLTIAVAVGPGIWNTYQHQATERQRWEAMLADTQKQRSSSRPVAKEPSVSPAMDHGASLSTETAAPRTSTGKSNPAERTWLLVVRDYALGIGAIALAAFIFHIFNLFEVIAAMMSWMQTEYSRTFPAVLFSFDSTRYYYHDGVPTRLVFGLVPPASSFLLSKCAG